jgi:hypothetical protein
MYPVTICEKQLEKERKTSPSIRKSLVWKKRERHTEEFDSPSLLYNLFLEEQNCSFVLNLLLLPPPEQKKQEREM